MQALDEDEPGHLIAWKSLEGASVRHSGRIEFLDSLDGRGTVILIGILAGEQNTKGGAHIGFGFKLDRGIQHGA